MKYEGQPCGKTSETKSCNGQACEKDCELSDWSKWGKCSKDCDGGTRKRQKFVTHEPEGAGKCPDLWSIERLEYKKCNMQRCVTDGSDVPLKCNKSLDVILLLDGSGSIGKKGWEATKKVGETIINSFNTGDDKAQIAVLEFSGPSAGNALNKCVDGDVKDFEKCSTLRKIEVGEAVELLDTESRSDKGARHRFRACKDGVEGWLTVQGNHGTIFAEETEKIWTVKHRFV